MWVDRWWAWGAGASQPAVRIFPQRALHSLCPVAGSAELAPPGSAIVRGDRRAITPSTVATAATLTRSHVLLRAGLRAVSRCTAPRMVTAPSQIMNAPYPPVISIRASGVSPRPPAPRFEATSRLTNGCTP